MGKRRLIYPGVLFLALLFALGGSYISQAAQPWATESIRQTFLPLIAKPSNLKIMEVKVIQGTSMSESYAVYIADRTAVARIFVTTLDGSSQPGVTGRMCGYNSVGSSLGCIPATNGSITAPSQENNLFSTLNFSLPASWLKPGYSYHVDLNPADLVPDGDPVDDRYPDYGTRPFNFTVSSPLDVVIVPIYYTPYPESAIYSPPSDLTYLIDLSFKLLPIPALNFQVRDPPIYYASGSSAGNLNQFNGWSILLNQLTYLHETEDPSGSKNYFGVVNSFAAHGCTGGCITGIGWIGRIGQSGYYKTAVGWSGRGWGDTLASKTMVHELGHNFGRYHVKCSGEGEPTDGSYPYANGSIGQFGLDVGTWFLYSPSQYADYMSYCKDAWTSDYTYWNINQFRQSVAPDIQVVPTVGDALYVSGLISPSGEVSLRPVYRQQAALRALSEGSYKLELLGANGRLLAGYPFTPLEIGDGEGHRGFGFFVPAVEGLTGLRVREGERVLAEKMAPPAKLALDLGQASLTVDRGREKANIRLNLPDPPPTGLLYRLRLSQDGGQTWEMLALDQPEPRLSILATSGLNLQNALLEVQATDGLRTQTRVFEMGDNR